MKLQKFFILVFLLFFCPIVFGGSVTKENEVVIQFCYKDKVYEWNDSFWKESKIFEFDGIAQKNGRQKDNKKRAELIAKIVNLGFSFEDAFSYTFFGFGDLLDKICLDINVPMKNASVKFFPNAENKFVFSNEQIGFEVDKEKLLKETLTVLKNTNKVKVTIKPKVFNPEVTKKQLKEKTVLRSRFETDFSSSSQARKNNIKTALKNFNGLVLKPGVLYSFNKLTGRRTQRNGYEEANIILNNEYVEAFGGGVCQASTTLFNALILAGVDIKESHPHSLQSSYVMNGFDAMVNFGSSDLKWMNTTEDVMYVRTYYSDEKVGVEIFGARNPFEIRRVCEIEEIKALEDVIVEDENMFLGESFYKTYPKKGVKSKSILEYYKQGKLIKRKMFRTQTYKPVQGVRVVGTKIRQENSFFNEDKDSGFVYWKTF